MKKEFPEPIRLELELMVPKFKWYIKNLNPDIARWIQYSGLEQDDINTYIKFKASNCQLMFYLPLYFDQQDLDIFRAHTDSIMQYFRDTKYNIV
jgi:hypothetical protein